MRGPKYKLKLAVTKIGIIGFLHSDFTASEFNVLVKSCIQSMCSRGDGGLRSPSNGTCSRNSLALDCKTGHTCHLLRLCCV